MGWVLYEVAVRMESNIPNRVIYTYPVWKPRIASTRAVKRLGHPGVN